MWHAVPGLGVELDKPVIAATSGWVVGGGFVLVQMADMCVASETTRFSYPEVKIGTTGGGVSSVLARMPHKIAMEFLLVGEEMSAERAYQIGFVNKVAPKGQHIVLAQEMAAKDRRRRAAGGSGAEEAGARGDAEGAAGDGRRGAPAARRRADQRRSQGRRQGVQRKAQAAVQGEVTAIVIPGRRVASNHDVRLHIENCEIGLASRAPE